MGRRIWEQRGEDSDQWRGICGDGFVERELWEGDVGRDLWTVICGETHTGDSFLEVDLWRGTCAQGFVERDLGSWR